MAILNRLHTGIKSVYLRANIGRLLEMVGVRDPVIEGYYHIMDQVTDDYSSITVAGSEYRFSTQTASEVDQLTAFLEERSMVEEMVDDLSADNVVYDVGANVGMYSCVLDDFADQVHAFEPAPANVEAIHDNIRANGCERVHVHEVALGESNGQGTLSMNNDERGSPRHQVNGDSSTQIDIEIQAVDALRSQGELPAPDAIKIDVEGGEIDVLEGMRKTLEQDAVKAVYVETHGTETEVSQFFEGVGYGTTIKSIRNGQPVIVAKPKQ